MEKTHNGRIREKTYNIAAHYRNEPPRYLGNMDIRDAYDAAQKAIREMGADWVTATPIWTDSGPEMIRHSSRWGGVPGRDSKEVQMPG